MADPQVPVDGMEVSLGQVFLSFVSHKTNSSPYLRFHAKTKPQTKAAKESAALHRVSCVYVNFANLTCYDWAERHHFDTLNLHYAAGYTF